MGVITVPDSADSLRAATEAAGPWDLRVWAAPSCVAGLIVISALSMGGFWLRGAVVVGVGVLVVLSAMAWAGRVDRATALVLASSGALAAWWLMRATATGRALSFFPFGVSVVGFGAAFAAVRPLTQQQRQIATVVLASVGALEALVGFYGITMRSTPLAIADQGLWRLASTVTYSNAAGLILAMSLLVALGLNERWWYARGLVCVCVAGLLATQSRGALLGAACGMLFVPLARYKVMWVPMACGAVAGVVAVATSTSTRPEPVVGVALVLCVGAGAALRPVPVVWATRWRVLLAAASGLVLAGIAAVALHAAVARRLFTSASLFDRNPEWSSAYHQFLGAPWFGVGPDRLIPILGRNGSFAHYAHNEYLQVADDAGVIGLLLLAVVAVVVAKSVRRTDVATSCALGALITFAVCGAVDFDWHLPTIALMGGVVAGMAGGATAVGPGTDAPPPVTARVRPHEEAPRRRPPERSEKDLVNE